MFKKITFQKAPFVFIVLFFIIGYIVYPLIKLFLVSIHQPEILKQLIEPTLLTASFNSVLLSVITVMSSAVIGVYFAYIFHYVNIKFKSFFSSIVLLPIAIPPMVGVMSFLFLLGENGLLVKVFGLHHFSFSGWGAIIAIHLFSFYPLFFLFATNALKSTDNSTVEAAYILGASKFKTFFSVILPQL
jgi:iron(III) transport system permease protein